MRVDGFLAPTDDRRHDTYTAGMLRKRHRCGLNVQVDGSAHGTLILVDDPQPGAMHDAKARHASGPAALFTGRLHAHYGPGGLEVPEHTFETRMNAGRSRVGLDAS